LNNRNLKFVNFHNSLLPRHPGRNSPSWAIYEMDKRAGITWHEVVKAVDRGNIIAQESLPLTGGITGIELTRACANLGYECFKKILPSLQEDTYVPILQNHGTYKLHLSHEVPNNGVFDLNWPIVKMSAFLRALDYGIYRIFDKPKVNCDGQWHIISNYTVTDGCPLVALSPNADGELTFRDDKTMIRLKLVPGGER
jgi:methionyl-tRNA formyltransferase